MERDRVSLLEHWIPYLMVFVSMCRVIAPHVVSLTRKVVVRYNAWRASVNNEDYDGPSDQAWLLIVWIALESAIAAFGVAQVHLVEAIQHQSCVYDPPMSLANTCYDRHPELHIIACWVFCVVAASVAICVVSFGSGVIYWIMKHEYAAQELNKLAERAMGTAAVLAGIAALLLLSSA